MHGYEASGYEIEGKRRAYRKIKLRLRNIIPGIRRLHNHFLPLQRRVGESQLIARTARRVRTRHGREAVGEVIVYCPWGLRRAGVCGSALATGLGIWVRKRVVVDIAGAYDAGGLPFSFPGAGGLAAVLKRGRQ